MDNDVATTTMIENFAALALPLPSSFEMRTLQVCCMTTQILIERELILYENTEEENLHLMDYYTQIAETSFTKSSNSSSQCTKVICFQ